MKGRQHPSNDATINTSGNESIRDVLSRVSFGRREFLRHTAAASVAVVVGSVLPFSSRAWAAPIPAANGFGGIGFDSVAADITPVADAIVVPPGYRVEPLVAWGDPIMPGAPAWLADASQSAAVQEMQYGMHNDGMHFFPFPSRNGLANDRGLLCVNHEYTHEEVLHPDGLVGNSGYSIVKTRKSQAAHGVSVLEVRRVAGQWRVVKTSAFGRRITGNTPMAISGPAAGHPLLRSRQFDIQPGGSVQVGTNDGYTAMGTLNNCAHGYTPWGTYLTSEENWNGYFGWNPGDVLATGDPSIDATVLNDQTRYGVVAGGFGYRWHTTDPRFNARTNPLESYHFGWTVEIDPTDPGSVPVKRTALGRFKHESAQVAVSADASGLQNRVAFYQGDDERNEYVYKFVCNRPFDPRNRAANRDLLDDGILYVARFTDTAVPGKAGTFRGQWLPLVPDTLSVIDNPGVPGTKFRLRELALFAGVDDAAVQALILLKTRQAADAVGATMMDRPEWAALRTYGNTPGVASYQYSAGRPLEVYLTLTNNNRRGGGGTISSNRPDGTTAAGSARPPLNAANPRADNDYGHIIRWREDGNYVTATGFEWDIFVLCGDVLTTKTLAANYTGGGPGTESNYIGNIVDSPNGSADFGAPDGLWFDQFGRLWIQTDQAGDALGDWLNIGVNVMCCADPNTREIRRFMTSPRNCEVTGVVNTPDGKTMFVGIQHPGEDAVAANPQEFSSFPHGQFPTNSAGEVLPAGRPRSSVLVITRDDGGVIGA